MPAFFRESSSRFFENLPFYYIIYLYIIYYINIKLLVRARSSAQLKIENGKLKFRRAGVYAPCGYSTPAEHFNNRPTIFCILTISASCDTIESVLPYPKSTKYGGGCFLSVRGERNFLFLPSIRWREVVTMYITLTDLLMILSFLIALAEYFNNRRDK